MVNVYELRADPDRFRRLTMVRESDSGILAELRGRPVGRAWEPLEVETIEERPEDRALPLADFRVVGGAPTFSRRAVDALRDLLGENGELLPLRSTHGAWYLCNVTRVIDALDERGSYVVYVTTGRRIMAVRPQLFYPERLSAPVFKVPQRPSRVYVTGAFVARVQAAGLTGFEFVLAG